jgi:hypothetical protein
MSNIQLKRGDLVKVAMQALREQIAQEIRDAEAAVKVTYDEFVRAQRAEVLVEQDARLSSVCALCGTTTARLIADVHLDPTDDVLASPPMSVSMTLRDDEPYAARVVLRMKVAARERELGAWLDAVRALGRAQAKSLKSKALDADARAKMVDSLLQTMPEGVATLAALAVFTKAVRDHEDGTDGTG